MIEIETQSIQAAIREIQREYSHISGPTLNQAISRALNRTASASRTEANRNIRQIYKIGASQVNQGINIRNSSRTNLTAKIIAQGRPMSLTAFGARQESPNGTVKFNRKGELSRTTRKTRKRNPVSGVSFEVKKGNVERLASAFIQTANNGTTVFARGVYNGNTFQYAKERLPITKMNTVSLPSMFANNEVMQPTESNAVRVLNDRIVHEINWLLQR